MRARIRALWAVVFAVVTLSTVLGVLPSSSAVPRRAKTGVQETSLSGMVLRSGAEVQAKASATAKVQNQLVVIGDSVTRIFNDKPGSPRQGFWSMLARQVGARPRTMAQGGAGFVKPGLTRCKGRSFGQQLNRPELQRTLSEAGAVIIEGGRNDTRTCHKHGFREVSTGELKAVVNGFMDQLVRLRGRTDDCTIVFAPWGPKGTDQRDRIVPIIRRATESHGFRFVDTKKLLTEATTIEDGVHPTRAGNILITRAIMRQSFAEACFYKPRQS